MKAVVCRKYGGPSTLKLMEMPVPQPNENEVLVKVMATAVNDWDWALVRGKPLLYRLMFGLFNPKAQVFGVELAGTVEKVGSAVQKFEVGDRVYGDTSEAGFGGWAEFAAVPETALEKIPDSMSYETAASLPHASLLAYQGLVTMGGLKDGQNILINGAGGGVGTLGLQIAKTKDVHITGVDSEEKLSMMLQLGYDEVIDYRRTDFTKTASQYNLILDTKTTRGPLRLLKALKPDGRYITVGGSLTKLLKLGLLKGLIKLVSKKDLSILALKPNKGLESISKLYDQGIINPVIDGPYALEQIPQQLERFGAGEHKGKIVIAG